VNAIPLDLWAYRIHAGLRAPQLQAIGCAPAAALPAKLVDPLHPPRAADLAPHRATLDAAGAAVAAFLLAAGGRGRHLVAIYLGRGRAPDLAPARVEPGPGLRELARVVAALATREIGSAPLPDPPAVPGHIVKAHPAPCSICGARVWHATPAQPADQAGPDRSTVEVNDQGDRHTCSSPH
jgi:hypothetical protein